MDYMDHHQDYPNPKPKEETKKVGAELIRDNDRLQFPDIDFNRWLDTATTFGMTIWDEILDVESAYHAWQARPDYTDASGLGADSKVNAFPPRDLTKPAEAQGLFQKFNVQRTDGSSEPGGKHYGARYFVIDMDSDPHAEDALRFYAISCSTSHPVLSIELLRRYGYPSEQGFWGRACARQHNHIINLTIDKHRLDWLEHQAVNVRQDLRHGSRDLFWASPEVDDGDKSPSEIRKMIDIERAKS